jgi:outer membrane receptor for ferrienterochelin and colicin
MKITNTYRLILIIFYIIISTSYSQAQIDTSNYEAIYDTIAPKNDLLDLPMKDLMNMKVTVASKKEENIADAPSSITAYSKNEITNLGYYTLGDLATITSGYSVNYQYGESGFETRGQTAEGFNNNKHLLLIDGIPVNFARSYKAQIQEELPIFFAQRVEFLKGPASALYGVSAFYGVVSIISKEPVSNGTMAESKISLGNWDKNKRFMANVYHRNNNGTTSLSTGLFLKDPSQDFVGTTQNPYYRYWDQNNSFFINSSHKISDGPLSGFTLGVIYMHRNSGLGETWGNVNISSEVNTILWRTLIPYLKYQRHINKKLEFYSYLKGNSSIEEGHYQLHDKPDSLKAYKSLSIYRSTVLNIESLAELRYQINTRNSLIAGLNYDRRMEEGNPHSYAYSIGTPDTLGQNASFPLTRDFSKRSFAFNTLSGYMQFQKNFAVLSGLTLTGGLRYDLGIIDTFNYDQLSPRIAVVQKISPKLNLKIMTGRALRAPGIKEIGLTAQFLDELKSKNIPQPNLQSLKAEVIQTTEAGFYYSIDFMRVSSVLFYNKTFNEIKPKTLIIKNGSDTIRGNWIENLAGTTTSKGIEVDVMFIIKKQLTVFSNYTYALAKDQNNNFFKGVPLSKLNTGLMFNSLSQYKFKSSLVVKYIDGFLEGGDKKTLSKGFTFVDANLIFPVTTALTIELLVRNIMNQKIKFPPAGIPLPGRNFLITLSMNFK